MKTKITLGITLLVLMNFYANANFVNVDTAQTVALNFFKLNATNISNGDSLRANLKYTKTDGNGVAYFYVFDFAPVKGFVIVTAYDNMIPVIAYSTESNFGTDFQGTGVDWWMTTIAASVQAVLDSGIIVSSHISNSWSSFKQGVMPQTAGNAPSSQIGPLLKTDWGQGPANSFGSNFYNENYYCPVQMYSPYYGALAGGVAVAMAQIMYYWQYPQTGTGTPPYKPNYSIWQYPMRPPATFGDFDYNWSIMPSDYHDLSGPPDGYSSVDTLIYYCGLAVNTEYNEYAASDGLGTPVPGTYDAGSSFAWLEYNNGSRDPATAPAGSPCAQQALIQYFGFNANTIQPVNRNLVNGNDIYNSQWQSNTENELNAARPVMLRGAVEVIDASNWQNDQVVEYPCWVCDGYQSSTSTFHMNWGWTDNFGEPEYNGWYLMNNVASGTLMPFQFPEALIGIQPSQTNPPSTNLNTNNISTGGANFSWSAAGGKPTGYLVFYKEQGAANYTEAGQASTNAIPVSGLNEGTTYQWYVETVAADGSVSGPSPIVSFTTAMCGAPDSLYTSEVNSYGATVNWNAEDVALNYFVQYLPAGSSVWIGAYASGNSLPITGLLPGTNCQWFVQTICAGGPSTPSDTQTFTTACRPPDSLNFGEIINSSITINWTDLAGALGYNFQFQTIGQSPWNYTTGISPDSNEITLSGLVQNYIYVCQLQTICSNSGLSSPVTGIFNSDNDVETPTGLFADSIAYTQATLNWASNPIVQYYIIYYRALGTSAWTTRGSDGPSPGSINISGLLSGTTYQWFVEQSNFDIVVHGTSSLETFTTLTCNAPTGLKVLGVASNSAELTWGLDSVATSYIIYISGPGFFDTIPSSDNFNEPYPLPDSTTFYWKVSAVCPGGALSASSPVSSFSDIGRCVPATGLTATGVTDSTALLSWEAETVADTNARIFYLYYQVAGASSWHQDGPPISTPQHGRSATNLLPGTVYLWYVKSICYDGGENSSAIDTFITTSYCNPAVSISGNDTICFGMPGTFNAAIINGGNSPAYQWMKNGNVVGNNAPVYTDSTLNNNDSVWVLATSSNTCPVSVTAVSNIISMTVNPLPLTPEVSSNSPVLLGDTIELTVGTVNGAGYLWNGPNNYSTTVQNPVLLNAIDSMFGEYHVVAVMNGCNSIPAATIVEGIFISPTPFDLAYGRIYTDLNNGIDGVTVTASDSTSYTYITDSSGNYIFAIREPVVSANNTLTITPRKNNDSVVANGVTTVDLLLIQSHILKRKLLSSPYKIIAADVNGSGTVTALDLVLIQSLILEKISTFPDDKLWTFVPADYAFPDTLNPFPYPSSLNSDTVAQQINKDFIGMKLGDVNDSWNPDTRSLLAPETVSLQMDIMSAAPQSEISVAVRASNFKNVSGMQYTIEWDADKLEFGSLDSAQSALQINYGESEIQQGRLAIEWTDPDYSSTTLPDNSPLFFIKFYVKGSVGESSPLKISSSMAIVEIVDSSLQIDNYATTDGEVRIVRASAVNDMNANQQPVINVSPNPFNGGTNLTFRLYSASKITITVFDELGQEIEQSEANYNTGIYRKEMGNIWSEGVYFIRFAAGDFVQSLKVISTGK